MTNHKSADEPLPTSDKIAALPADGGPEFNRLIHEKSPYLLQHARNPVNWYPWSPEAFERAEKEDKPVFLSIGYSTCHWCHVMERESFENEEVAEILNRYYVSIKVDREERPDVDEIYMNATQLISGRGGWPNSLWLLPDGTPWYAGTYFPPEDGAGRPGFRTILIRLAEFWRTRRGEVAAQADKLAEAMKQITSGRSIETTGQLSRELVQRALKELNRSFDRNLGGFGAAPKFPPHGSFNLIFYEYSRSQDASLLEMATRTLDAMARGGIRDQVGGGFHRYSTDARWLLPHFEKMLYDNAQLGRAYVNAYLITKDENYRSVAVDIYEWVLREMTHQDGGFYSALDADSEGEEGKFYLWSRDEIIAGLGEKDGELFCRAYNIRNEGNFRDEATGEMIGTNIPHIESSLAEIAAAEGIPGEDLHSRLTKSRQKLLKQRNNRVWPHLDDKVLTAWNGLMIGSLAYGGRHLDEPHYTAAAEKAADFILGAMRKNGRLLRTYRDGEAKLNAYLDDYAFLAEGLLELYNDSGNERRLDEARELMDMLLRHYWDKVDGGFFFTPDDHEQLLMRSKDPYDKATPSGNGVAAKILVRLGLLTGERDYLVKAKASCDAFHGFMERVPGGTESLILALATYLDVMADVSLANASSKQSPDDIAADAYVKEGPVAAEAFISRLKIAPGENFEAAVRLVIDDGWHINSNKPLQEYLKPLLVTLEENTDITIDAVVYPQSDMVTFPFSPEPLAVYKDEVGIKINLAVAGDAGEGQVVLNFEIPVQPCNDSSCQASKALKLSVPVEIDRRADPKESRHDSIFRSFGAV